MKYCSMLKKRVAVEFARAYKFARVLKLHEDTFARGDIIARR